MVSSDGPEGSISEILFLIIGIAFSLDGCFLQHDSVPHTDPVAQSCGADSEGPAGVCRVGKVASCNC